MPRIDVLNALLGRGGFLDDYPYKGGKFGVFIRSPYPHARILSIDASKAVGEGGALVLTGKDFIARTLGSIEREGAGLEASPLAVDKARYQGEPVP
ncbi:hypothetical protein [Vulcanisaeta distributa]|uniref:hypothetical protein n=1 Tax=Vulcanisaeta distributa TaxID=164451 RepID=UPI000A533603|nr:hypothetical protein [Vulcanisaeta distributa]